MVKIVLNRVTQNDNLQFTYCENGLSIKSCTWVQDSNSIALPRKVRMMPTKAKMIACIIKAMNQLDHDAYRDELNETRGEKAYLVYRLAKKFYGDWKEEKRANKQS